MADEKERRFTCYNCKFSASFNYFGVDPPFVKNIAYYEEVIIKFDDGTPSINVTLDKPTLDRVRSGDRDLINNIKQNYQSALTKEKEVSLDSTCTQKTKHIHEEKSTNWSHSEVMALIHAYSDHTSEMDSHLIKKTEKCESSSLSSKALANKRRRQWKVLVKRANVWKSLYSEADVPSFICMAMKGNQIRFEGPSHMQAFAEDEYVQRKFIECCLSRTTQFRNSESQQEMTITEERQPIVLPGVDPSTYTWQGLCLLLPRLVKQYYNTDDKNVWQNQLQPTWWPKEVAFKSPNHSRDNSPRLTVCEMQLVLRKFLDNCKDLYITHSEENVTIKYGNGGHSTGSSSEGNSTMSVGNSTSSMENSTSSVGNSTSSVENSTSSVGNSTSSVGNSTSSVENSTSSVGNSTSSVENSTSSVGNSTSSVGNSTSSVGNSTSSVGNSTSSVENSTSFVGNSTSSVENSTSSVENSTSSVENSTSSVENHTGSSSVLLTSSEPSLKEMDAVAKRILTGAIYLKDGVPSIKKEEILHAWAEYGLKIPKPDSMPTDLGRVDRRFHCSSFSGKVFKSTGMGDCLYCSISLLLYGTEDGKHLLRLACVIYGIEHLQHLVQQTITSINNADEAVAFVMAFVNPNAISQRPKQSPSIQNLIEWCFEREIVECARVGAYSGLLQVKLLSTAIGIPIQQHCLEAVDVYETCQGPCECMKINAPPIHILWSRMRSHSELNHIQPVRFYDENTQVPEPCPLISKKFTHKCLMEFDSMCNGGDTWIQCENCLMWAHTLCVGMPDDSDTLYFSCCGDTKTNPVILTWPPKKKNPKIHEMAEDILLTDVKSVFSGNGLSDGIINMYLRYILAKYIDKSVFLASSQLTNDIFTMGEHTDTHFDGDLLWKRHLKNDNIKDKSVLIFPLCISEMWHWVLVVVCVTSKRMFLLDSLGKSSAISTLHSCFQQFINFWRKKELLPCLQFYEMSFAKVPKQEGVDCGVHLLENAKRLFEKFTVSRIARLEDLSLQNTNIKGTKVRATILCSLSALSTAQRH